MTREEARKRAEALVDQMTVEEMASQMRYDAPAIERLGIPAYNWWSEGLHGVARSGVATVFPQAIGLAAAFDTDMMRKIGECVGEEARGKYNESVKRGDHGIYKGLTLWTPNVNIFRDPRWGRGQETYGEDPYLTGQYGTAMVKGMQGGGENLTVAACAKHFAGHSGPEADRHHFDAKISKKELFETYLPAFEMCVKDAQVESVMGAYNRLNGEPACASRFLMDTLRSKWGFEGHFVSDCWAIRDFHEEHHVTKTAEESAALAVKTGCDLNCGCTYQKIMNAIKKKTLTRDDLRQAAVRLFTTRMLLGMFDQTELDDISQDNVDSAPHRALNLRAARETVVLLKNDGLLPLDPAKLRSIGVIGPNAMSRTALIGNYHGTASEYVTIVDGIRMAVREMAAEARRAAAGKAGAADAGCGSGEAGMAGTGCGAAGGQGAFWPEDEIRVRYAQGCHLFKMREEPLAEADDRLAEALSVAEHSDVVVLCVGLNETLEGEEGDTGNAYASGDKRDLSLPESQQRLMKAVLDSGTPCIVIMMAGSAMDLREADEKAAAVLYGWYPGARGGEAVAEILFGKISPSGKLPITLYRDLDGFPEFTDYSMKGRTYRFYEKDALYPFGYGLTYGKTEVVDFSVKAVGEDGGQAGCSTGEAAAGTSSEGAAQSEGSGWVKPAACASLTVRNLSDRAVDEVLQVYVKAAESALETPNPHLAAFARIHLEAGEEKSAELVIPARAFEVVGEDGEAVRDGNRWQIFGGIGQPDRRTKELLGENIIKAVEFSF